MHAFMPGLQGRRNRSRSSRSRGTNVVKAKVMNFIISELGSADGSGAPGSRDNTTRALCNVKIQVVDANVP